MNKLKVMEGNGKEAVLFGSIPKLCDLYSFLLSIDPKEEKDPSVKSDYQWQILKCRLLIFSDKEVLATPLLGSLQNIYAIVRKSYYESGHLSVLLQKYNLKSQGPQSISPMIFEACFKYSLYARLSPNWNKVDKYLVQGRNFLTSTDSHNAVTIGVSVNEKEAVIFLTVNKLHLPKLSLDDFITPDLHGGITGTNFIYDLTNGDNWAYVLPSMKRGRVVSVSNTLPPSSVFKNYNNLRRHWKNTYGYRIPDTDKDMLYVGIKFFGPTVFTYPIHCVASCPPFVRKRADSLTVMNDFVKDILRKFPTVCGTLFVIESQVSYPDPHLNNPNRDENGNFNRPNLTLKPPKVNLKTIDDLENNEENNQINESYKQERYFPQYPIEEIFPESKGETDDITETQDVSFCTPSQNETKQLTYIKVMEQKSNISKPPLIVPTFVRKLKPGSGGKVIILEKNELKRELVESESCSSACVTSASKPKRPIFIPAKPKNPADDAKLLSLHYESGSSSESSKPLFVPVFKPKLPIIVPKEPVFIKPVVPPVKISFNRNKSSNLKISPTFIAKSGHPVTFNALSSLPRVTVKPSTITLPNHLNDQVAAGAGVLQPLNQKQNLASIDKPTTLSSVGREEKTMIIIEEVKKGVKKDRGKKIVKNVDVEKMAKDKMLDKVNAPVLISFLKEKGIPCKHRDRKNELVNKVVQYLNAQQIQNKENVN